MRILSISALTLAAALSAGIVSAQSINPGAAQIAAQIGVSANDYSLSQLIAIQNAIEAGDQDQADYLLSQKLGASLSSSGNAVSAGAAQLATQLGVTPGSYSVGELALLADIDAGNSDIDPAYVLSRADRTSADVSVTNAGKLQLAASLGVNANDYTLSQLVAMDAEANQTN